MSINDLEQLRRFKKKILKDKIKVTLTPNVCDSYCCVIYPAPTGILWRELDSHCKKQVEGMILTFSKSALNYLKKINPIIKDLDNTPVESGLYSNDEVMTPIASSLYNSDEVVDKVDEILKNYNGGFELIRSLKVDYHRFKYLYKFGCMDKHIPKLIPRWIPIIFETNNFIQEDFAEAGCHISPKKKGILFINKFKC